MSKSLPETPNSLRVGCVGGGQLGRMMAIEAPRLNISMSFLDPVGQSCPAAHAAATHESSANSSSNIVKVIQGSLNDEAKLKELAEGCDVITMEIEHVGVEGLKKLEEAGVNVQPSARVIETIQDKFDRMGHFQKIPRR